MIAPCVACGTELKVRGKQQHHCLNDDCNLGYAHYMARTHVVRVGECEVWQGSVRVKRGARVPVVRVVTERVGSKRLDLRVLALRDPDRDLAANRVYDRLCGTEDCVTLDHHRLRRQEVVEQVEKEREPRLPAGPLVAAFDAYLERIEGVCRADPQHLRLVDNARRVGTVALRHADEFCIDVLRVHPTAIYGKEFYTA
jgi:hypothetical protein